MPFDTDSLMQTQSQAPWFSVLCVPSCRCVFAGRENMEDVEVRSVATVGTELQSVPPIC